MGMRTDPRVGKTFWVGWDEWREVCAKHGLNPHENCEVDLDAGGGGNVYTVAIHESDIPEVRDE